MLPRTSKIFLLLFYACYMLLAFLNNLANPEHNHEMVTQVLEMNNIFLENRNSWRAIRSTHIHNIFFYFIMIVEFCSFLLCLFGSINMFRNVKNSNSKFNDSKSFAILGLLLGAFLWFFAFIIIGGEWFMMWQSSDWNGVPVAFRNTAITLLLMIYITNKDE